MFFQVFWLFLMRLRVGIVWVLSLPKVFDIFRAVVPPQQLKHQKEKNMVNDKGSDTGNGRAENPKRRERLAGHVRRCVSETMCMQGVLPFQVLEEIEGCSIFDLITDRLCVERGIGVENPSDEQRHKFTLDSLMEKKSARTLYAHEKTIAHVAVYNWLMKSPLLSRLETWELRRVLEMFYRRGDMGTGAAELRALRFAVARYSRKRSGVGVPRSAAGHRRGGM